MVVTATYSDGSTVVTTDYNYTPSGKLAVGDSAVTITYTGSDARQHFAACDAEDYCYGILRRRRWILITTPLPSPSPIVIKANLSPAWMVPCYAMHLLPSMIKIRTDAIPWETLFAALHEMYYSGGASGYEEIDTDGGGWVNKFWGNRSGNISYVLNHSWVNGPKTEIEGNDKLAVYAYKDLVQYSDLYTWFEEDSYNASVGTEKVFTVHGINVMNSSEIGTARQLGQCCCYRI